MTSKEDIDVLIASFVSGEQNIEPNPFLVTRVMSLIESADQQRIIFPVWQRAAMALSIVVAVVLGIKAGSMYQPANIPNDQSEVMFTSDDQMEHFEFYRQSSKN